MLVLLDSSPACEIIPCTMNKTRSVSVFVLSLAILVIFTYFILVWRSTLYASFTKMGEVDIGYILSTQKEPQTLPFGELTVFPDFRYVALYGSPLYPALGVLGEQPIEESIDRAKKLASQYQKYSSQTVIPTLEIITTIASDASTKNNDYSQETEANKLMPWIKAAKEAGLYVVLDLQPGRSTFLTQARKYQKLLLEPHVGLALDPEWRLKSDELHLQQIGSVTASEVNQVSRWLADLTRDAVLPQKLFLVHQFSSSMIENRAKLDTSREELGYVIQMDGQGTEAGKNDTYAATVKGAPPNIYFGWKNFYDEDDPLRSPADTMKVTPKPWFVSYQ